MPLTLRSREPGVNGRRVKTFGSIAVGAAERARCLVLGHEPTGGPPLSWRWCRRCGWRQPASASDGSHPVT